MCFGNVPNLSGGPCSSADQAGFGRRAETVPCRSAASRRGCSSLYLMDKHKTKDDTKSRGGLMFHTRNTLIGTYVCSWPDPHSGWCGGSGASPSISSSCLWPLRLQAAKNTRHVKRQSVGDDIRLRRPVFGQRNVWLCRLVTVIEPSGFMSVRLHMSWCKRWGWGKGGGADTPPSTVAETRTMMCMPNLSGFFFFWQ